MSILVFAIVVMVGPLIAGSFENTMPDLAATSEWNKSYNTDIPASAQVWEETIPFLIVAAIVFIVAILLYVIRMVA